MPSEFGFGVLPFVLPLVALGFIALVTLTIAVVVASRVIRLARGGPDAERLRQHLLLEQRATRRDGLDPTPMSDHQAMFDLQHQQSVIDLTNPASHQTPPS